VVIVTRCATTNRQLGGAIGGHGDALRCRVIHRFSRRVDMNKEMATKGRDHGGGGDH
jgi:hypothetical protein